MTNDDHYSNDDDDHDGDRATDPWAPEGRGHFRFVHCCGPAPST